MQFNQTEINDLTAVITLTVEPADYQEAVQKELIQIRKKANIPGFRPGMAPKGMLQKMAPNAATNSFSTSHRLSPAANPWPPRGCRCG